MSTLVIANWKMNGAVASVEAFAQAWAGVANPEKVSVVICPSFAHLSLVREAMPRWVQLGAQDCSERTSGAFTGDVSAAMLSDLGCQWVIVGHSERRACHSETDSQVAQKAQRAQQAGLQVAVCVGEQLWQRETSEHHQVVAAQLAGSLEGVSPEGLAIAYEPIWAIGTGHAASTQQAEDMHGQIRHCLAGHYGEAAESIKVIYGGSVKPATARALFASETIDGALVGGASLEADSFAEIARAGTFGRK